MRKIKIIGLVMFIMLLSLSSCASLDSISISLRGNTSRTTSSMGNFRNNSVVQLESGTYRGNLNINANSVTLVGAGKSSTVITGDITINGNNTVLKNLRVRGDVYIHSNNNDLTQARIDGRVISSGQNNSW